MVFYFTLIIARTLAWFGVVSCFEKSKCGSGPHAGGLFRKRLEC
jgi:hypothetical protein